MQCVVGVVTKGQEMGGVGIQCGHLADVLPVTLLCPVLHLVAVDHAATEGPRDVLEDRQISQRVKQFVQNL